MKITLTGPRYNHRNPHMRARTSSSLRPGWLTSPLLAIIFLSSSLLLSASYLSASSLADAARQLAHKIAADAGPGAFVLEVTNRSSLDDKSVREVRGGLDAELHVQGVQTVKAEQAMGTIMVVLSESLREYVWTAETVVGSDEKKIAMVSLPRPPTAAAFAPALPINLKASLIFAGEQRILDVSAIDMPGGARLLVLNDSSVAIYRRVGSESSGRWDLETSLPIVHSRAYPRDLRGRLLLRRDHLFDVYLPGTYCRSSSSSSSSPNSNVVASLSLICNNSDDPWPLTWDDNTVRAFFAASRNFFTGALSPGIGKVSNLPSFYSAAAFPRSGYTLWAVAAVDGSLHFVDGMTDQLIRGAPGGDAQRGSDLASVRSGCGSGTQLLISDSGNSIRDNLRAFEIPDRDPVAVSSAVDFDGQIVALWPENTGSAAIAIVRRETTGWYEAYRVSISCN